MVGAEPMIELKVPDQAYEYNQNSESRPDYERNDKWAKLFNNYWAKSSISGIPFITSTKYSVVRVIWTILLIIACVAMTFHLVYLSAQYFSYKKQSKIDLNFENLRFPAITVCNANPFRRSMLSLTSSKMQKFSNSFKPDTLRKAVERWGSKVAPERPADLSNGTTGGDSDDSDKLASSSFLDDFDVNYLLNLLTSQNQNEDTNGLAEPDDLTFTSPQPIVYADQLFGEEFPDSWEAESKPSSHDIISRFLITLSAKEPPSVRQKIGHQIEDMLIQCSFSGRKCSHRFFTLDSASTYGNCFTIEHPKFVNRRSGIQSGLKMILYLESDEYVKGIANSQGLQLVVHEPGTLPFPDDEGFAIGAGTNTFIGLKMLEIKRLGGPHGHCTSTDAFEEKYGVVYTRQICQKLCLLERIWASCHCFDSSTLMLKKLVKVPQDIPPCMSEAEKACMASRKHEFRKYSQNCSCDNPCMEKQYKKMISTRQWPHPEFARVMVSTICMRSPGIRCQQLLNKTDNEIRNMTTKNELRLRKIHNKTDDEIRHEFVKLDIYYEDLNYERLEENPDYEASQFMSDIGGTIGLWIGLSLLSVFEIIHLLVHIVLTYCSSASKTRIQ